MHLNSTRPIYSTTRKSTFFQSQIGVLRWIAELGRIDIITEVSELSTFLAMPREGHLEAVFHVFNYLEKRHNLRIVFDTRYPTIDMTAFKDKCDWKSLYGKAREAIPPAAPTPCGKDVDIRMFVDSDHAGDKRTRRSNCFIIFLNMAPIVRFSKKQATIKASFFGAEFVASYEARHGMPTLTTL